jgi:aminoglycoside phosphotransferase (APT) family kinase protein
VVDSISKTHVTREQATSIVRDAFGDGVTLVEYTELTEGWFNAAYTLGLDDGRRFVLKVSPPPDVAVLGYEHDILHAELGAFDLTRAHTSLPVPEVVWVDDAVRLPSPSFVMTFVPGVSLRSLRPTMPPASVADLERQIGAHLHEVHAITAPTFGLLSPAMPKHARWRDAFGELVEMLLRDGERASVELPIADDDVRDVVAAAASVLDEVDRPRLVLWDLWDGNVMVDPDTHALTGYLDFERAMWADPLMEAQFGAAEPSSDLLDGYGSPLLATDGERHRRSLYTLYLHLVMSIEGSYRQYSEDPIGAWARGQLEDDLARCRGHG